MESLDDPLPIFVVFFKHLISGQPSLVLALVHLHLDFAFFELQIAELPPFLYNLVVEERLVSLEFIDLVFYEVFLLAHVCQNL